MNTYILFFANLLPHINNTGKSVSSVVKANETTNRALYVLVSSETFVRRIGKFKLHVGGCRTPLVDAHCDILTTKTLITFNLDVT